MNDLMILTFMIHSEGESAFAYSFSAKSIAEDQHVSVYRARQALKELREWGFVQRSGNRYMFTNEGWNIAKLSIAASQKYHMFKVRS